MPLQTLGVIISLVTSVGAFALGILNYLQTRHDRQLRMKVTIGPATTIAPTGEAYNFFAVTAVNMGVRLIRIDQIGIILPNGHRLVTPIPAFGERPPKDLEGGQSFMGCLIASELARVVKTAGYGAGVKIKGFIEDAQGRRYTSRTLDFDPDIWLSPTGA